MSVYIKSMLQSIQPSDVFINDKIAFNAMECFCVYCVLANFFLYGSFV